MDDPRDAHPQLDTPYDCDINLEADINEEDVDWALDRQLRLADDRGELEAAAATSLR